MFVSQNIYVKQMYWIPEDLLEKRVREDKIPYDILAAVTGPERLAAGRYGKRMCNKW